MIEEGRFKVVIKRQESDGRVAYGVFDTVRAMWVSESYYESQCNDDAEYLNKESEAV